MLDFALLCTRWGNSVRWFKYSTKPTRDGEGFKDIEMVDDWRLHMKWAKDGLIITSGNWRYLHELDSYREFGYEIFSPTVASAKLEIDRDAGMEAMKAAGIDIAPYEIFDSLQDAEKFALKADSCYVFKPLGDEADKSLTYVAHDPADLVGWLRQKISGGKKLKGKCMLQEKLDMVGEISVSGWFGPNGFLPNKYQLCFEFKKLMPGDIGQNTGEMGSVVQYVETDKLVTEALLPMAPILKVLGHRGDFCISGGIDPQGKFWPFEFTARLGWPAFFLQCASHKGDPAKWMRDLLDGKDTLRVTNDVCIGVVVGQPPFPIYEAKPEQVEGNPIAGIEEDDPAVHLVSAMKSKGPRMEGDKIVEDMILQTTGPYVLAATGLGKTVKKAQDKVYKTLGNIKIKDMLYRNDIGSSLEEKLPIMHKHAYAVEMDFE